MTDFRYVRISESFVAELGGLLSRGESVVLLGPRNIGKRYLIRRLVDALAPTAAGRLGRVSFLNGAPAEDEVPAEASGGAIPGPARLEPRVAAVLGWVDERLRAADGRVALCAANVDALPHAEIQEFLSGLGGRVDGRGAGEGRLAVALTGEGDLRRFVSDPRREFTCTNHFVIQGFARAEFLAFAGLYVSLLGPNVEPLSDRMLDQLYDRTGGNTYLLRLLLWSIFEHQASMAGATFHFHPASMAHLPAEIVLGQPPWTYYLRAMTRLIDDDPNCRRDLERLLAGGRVLVGGAPHVLELAGVAVREDGWLTLPETLVRDYVQRRYTPRRFADLYVREAAWRRAFRRYNQVAPEELCRPSSLDDMADAEEAVKHLSASLFREAANGPDDVLCRFRDGCRYIMGFPEVTRWRPTDADWELIREPLRRARKEPTFDRPDAGCADEYRALLAGIPPMGDFGPVAVDPAQQSCLRVVRVPTYHPDLREVIIVGRPGAQNILSRAREQMTDRLIDDFLAAHGHAWDARNAVARAALQEGFTEIASEIVKRLGTETRDMKGVLRLAARLLRTRLHYKRVCVSVIDPERARTVPVALDADPGLPGIADRKPYGYRLDDDRPSATVWTVKEGRPCVMQDATTDPRSNSEDAAALGIKATALIPLLDVKLAPDEQVVGIVQVERADGKVPTPSEVDALVDFGKKLAVALKLNEQIAMLQGALDTLPQPIAIFDRAGRTRYLNKLAMEFLVRRARWYPAGKGLRYDELARSDDDRTWLETFVPLLEETFKDGKSHSRRTNVTIRETLHHLDAMAKPIWDWRKRLRPAQPVDTGLMVGALFQAQDVSYLSRAFEALLITAGGRQEDVIDRTLEVMRSLGHRWCRLYVRNRENPSELVSRSCFGPEPDVSRWRDKFNGGGYVIPRFDNDERWEGWECLKRRRPLVLFHDTTQDDRKPVRNKYDLEAINCRDQKCDPELRKPEHGYWIDFPLVTSDEVFGKLTLEWQRWRSPEDVKTLEVLCQLFSWLLGEAARRETYAQRALRAQLHRIKTPAAPLQDNAILQGQLIDELRAELNKGGLLPAYTPFLKRLDDTVADFQKSCDKMAKRIEEERKEHKVFPNITPTDLADLIQGTLPIPSDRFRVELGTVPETVHMDLDGHGFGRMLREMFDNAERFSHGGRPVRVTVGVELFEHQGGPWVRVSIEDDGPGILEDIKHKIFDPEFRTAHPDGNVGWGVGLSDARDLIVEHGGTIREDGENGARFVIELPRYRKA